MKRLIATAVVTLSIIPGAHALKSPDANGDHPIFVGVLTSQEGNVFNVTNVTVGRSASAHDKVTLYEMPKDLKSSSKGNMISVNPYETLTTAQLELIKIKKITVPNPQTTWKWKNPEDTRASSMAKEFIEVVITWKSGSAVHYLLELGPENTRRPIKIYSEVIDKPIKGTRQDGTLFCANINKDDLRKKGAPFQSVKSLVLDEPCFKVPADNVGIIKQPNNNQG